MKLSIGQRGRRDGWVTLDAHPRSNADIIGGVPPLPSEIKDNSCTVIEMIHFLEHLYLWDSRELLRECFRVLVPGGKLVVECPNIEYAARVMCGLEDPPRGASGQFDLWPLYGDPTHKDPLYGHRWGFTPESLERELLKCGWFKVGIANLPARSHFPIRDFRMEATKM